VDVGGCGRGRFILEELAIPDLNLIKQVKQVKQAMARRGCAARPSGID
jgi:hypothetical protein